MGEELVGPELFDEDYLWFDDLCGHPHKSAYAEARLMPRTSRNRWRVAEERSEPSA